MANTDFYTLINSEKPILFDFYADWCGPCKVFEPIVQEVKNEIGDVARVIKINIDRNQAIADQLNVMSIPTVMLFHKGELKYEGKGVHSKSDLISKIKDCL